MGRERGHGPVVGFWPAVKRGKKKRDWAGLERDRGKGKVVPFSKMKQTHSFEFKFGEFKFI